jgi:aldose sugar dehydrogenase
VTLPKEFDDKFGRLRGVRSGPDGALYVTTSNGDNDKLLRVTPS